MRPTSRAKSACVGGEALERLEGLGRQPLPGAARDAAARPAGLRHRLADLCGDPADGLAGLGNGVAELPRGQTVSRDCARPG